MVEKMSVLEFVTNSTPFFQAINRVVFHSEEGPVINRVEYNIFESQQHLEYQNTVHSKLLIIVDHESFIRLTSQIWREQGCWLLAVAGKLVHAAAACW